MSGDRHGGDPIWPPPLSTKETIVKDKDLTLVEMIRNPRMSLCEASELTRDGHYYLYRYDGSEGTFYRATVPSGAGDMHFRKLGPKDTIPLGGWAMVEATELSDSPLTLVTR